MSRAAAHTQALQTIARIPPELIRTEYLRRRRQTYREHPEVYAAEVLGVRWWSKQIEIAAAIRQHRRVVIYAGNSVGKTHLMAGLVQWHFDCFQPSITLTTAPSWAAIHDLLWGEIKAQRPVTADGRLMDMRLVGGPLHYAAGHNAESAAGFQGRHEARQLIVLDEAMGIPGYIWDATEAMMTAPNCRTVALGNPTETGGRYHEIREDPSWHVIHVSCLEHPNIVAELSGQPPPYTKAVSLMWVNEMLTAHGVPTASPTADSIEFPSASGQWYDVDDVFRSRVLGFFPRQASNALWSEAWIAVARTTPLAWTARDPVQIGVDVAAYGDDHTVLYARRGPVVTHRESYAKQDVMTTTGVIGRLADKVAAEHKLDAKCDVVIAVDDTGMVGVVARLKEVGYRRAAGVNFGARALQADDYFNRATEMWMTLARRAQDRRLDLTRVDNASFQRLAAELRARRYKIQSDKTLRIESKDDIKRRIGRSPDDGDALALAFTAVDSPVLVAPVAVGERASPWRI